MWPLSLAAIVAVVAAQQDPIQDFCRRHQHQTCIIDNKLYVDGGKVYYGSSVNNDSVALQNTRLLWEDVLATDNVTSFPAQYKNLTKDSEVPSVSGGVLWPDTVNKLFYLFGGEYNDVASVQNFVKLWFFDVVYNTWNHSTTADGSQSGITWPAFGSSAVSDAGIAYYYGGYLNNKTTKGWGEEPQMLSSLVTFDMNTQSWTNRSYDGTPRAEGTLQYLPASSKGMLVYIGGVEMDQSGTMQFANMSQIRLYDINESKWFTQNSTGIVPSPRRGMCSGVIWAEDRSSYNIYMHGGIGPDGLSLGEAYILTIPSFQWTMLYPDTVAELPSHGFGKAWSSCNIVRNSQMIVMGGWSANKSISDCDVPEAHGQHGLLLGQESVEANPPNVQWYWRIWAEYNKYRVPDKLTSIIGGNTEGHATKTEPALGWATPSLAGYFKGANYAPPRTATRELPNATSTNDSVSDSESSSKTNIGAIVGGVVGGVAGLAAILLIAFCCLKRRKRNREVAAAGTHGSPEMAHPNAAATTDATGTTKPELDGQVMGQKSNVNAYYHQGSQASDRHTMLSSTVGSPTPQYSPQSPPYDWSAGPHAPYQQTYYPPPTGAHGGQMHPHEFSHELPDMQSPAAHPAELSDVSSPVQTKMSPGTQYPTPK